MIRKRTLVWLCLLLVPCASVLAQEASSLDQGIQLFDNEQFDEARTFFTSVLARDAANTAAAYYLGRIAIVKEEWETAGTWLEQAVKQEDTNSTYATWLGLAYLEQVQNEDAGMLKRMSLAKKVQNTLKKAIELDPDNVDARLYLGNFYLHAPGIGGGSKKKALEQAQEVVQRDPRQGYLFLAEVHMERKKYDEAEQAYLALRDRYPQDAQLLYQLGMFYQGRERYAEAVDQFEQAVRADPEAGYAYYQIGRTSVFSGQNLDRAIEALTIYLAHHTEPNDTVFPPSAHWRLGMLHERKGDKEQARVAYQKALQLDPEHEAAQKALAKLQ